MYHPQEAIAIPEHLVFPCLPWPRCASQTKLNALRHVICDGVSPLPRIENISFMRVLDSIASY